MVSSNQVNKYNREVIGLLPAGGRATRIAPLPCSKELYPLGFHRIDEGGALCPKVVCHYLLEKMCLAGITKAYIVLRQGKWDIPAYLGDGQMFDMHLAYLMMRLPFGAPYTIDQAYPFVQDHLVAFGFPDILFEPDDAYVRLLKRQAETNADVVLGLFPVDQPQKWDMVDFDEKGRIHQILIKPPQSYLRHTWIIAVWTGVFTQFMHRYLSAVHRHTGTEARGDKDIKERELFVGDVIQAAVLDHLHVEGVLFPEGTCLDIGTPDDLVKAVRAQS